MLNNTIVEICSTPLTTAPLRPEARNNREAIKAIADTVIFLGREGVPFRGHEDDTKHHAEVGEQSINSVGLFVNLLNFQVSRGDNMLGKSYLTNWLKKSMKVVCLPS